MTRVRSLVSVLMGAMLSTGAVAGCKKDKVETPAEQVEPVAETETSTADRPVPSLPAPGGKEVEPAEPVAPEARTPGVQAGQDGQRRMRGSERRAAMLERFDQNQDGKIDETERGAMRGARATRMIERFDSDGDGSLSKEELAAMEGQSRGRRRFIDIAKADANGDGSVTAEELETQMAERLRQRRAERDGAAQPEGATAPEGTAEPEGAAQPQ